MFAPFQYDFKNCFLIKIVRLRICLDFSRVIFAISSFKKGKIEAIIFWEFSKKMKKPFPNKLQNGDICVTWVLGC